MDPEAETAETKMEDDGEPVVETSDTNDAGAKTEEVEAGTAEDVEMGESSALAPVADSQKTDTEEDKSVPVPLEANGDDVDMTSSQPKLPDPTPPTSTAAPSRQPSPSRTKSNTFEKPKARPLICVRHSICHSASLLSLSFDRAGK